MKPKPKSKAKYLYDIVLHDPTTSQPVFLTIFRHENGRVFGVDASYLDEVVTLDKNGHEIINDPFSDIIIDPNNAEHKKQPKAILKNTKKI